MTKMHVLAKCVVTVLGVYLINVILGIYPVIFSSGKIGPKAGAIIIICIYLLLCTVIYFIFFRHWDFASKLAGPVKSGESPAAVSHSIKALRIAIVFAGLMMLPGALQGLVHLLKLPAMLRALLFAAFGLEQFSHQLPKDGRTLVNTLNSLVRVCLTVYLIIGAPSYVRWQVRKVTITKSEPDVSDAPVGG